jgi:drug/metabolite transporter (DMT)-like permease
MTARVQPAHTSDVGDHSRKSPLSRAYTIGLLTCLISTLTAGPSMAVIKLIEQDLPASQLIFVRGVLVVGVISLILGIMGRMTRQNLRANKPSFFLINAFLWSVGTAAFYLAIQAADLAIINAVLMAGPLITMLIARLLLGERISRLQQLGIAIAFLGILLCILPAVQVSGSALLIGIGFAAVRMLTKSSAAVMSRHLACSETIEVLLANFLSIPMALYGLLFEDWIALDTRSILCILGFSAIQILVTFMSALTMQRLPAAISSSIGYLQLPSATVFGWLVFSEVPSLWFYLGSAVLIAGLSLSSGVWRPGVGRKKVTPLTPEA